MSDANIEHEARKLHQAIYGPSSDQDWDDCKDIWTQNIQWLRDNQNGGHHERRSEMA